MDLAPYAHCREFQPDGSPFHMDDHHVSILHDIAMALPQGAVIAEIGSRNGYSTAAFLEALKLRPDLKLHIIEIEQTRILQELIIKSGVRDRIVQHDYPSDQSLEYADLVLIDGNHTIPGALTDLTRALVMGCDAIVLHDTQTEWKTEIEGCEGSALAGRLLRDSPQRLCWEDSELREGQLTERGLLVSWPMENTWIRPVIGKLCPSWKWMEPKLQNDTKVGFRNTVNAVVADLLSRANRGLEFAGILDPLKADSPVLFHAAVAEIARIKRLFTEDNWATSYIERSQTEMTEEEKLAKVGRETGYPGPSRRAEPVSEPGIRPAEKTAEYSGNKAQTAPGVRPGDKISKMVEGGAPPPPKKAKADDKKEEPLEPKPGTDNGSKVVLSPSTPTGPPRGSTADAVILDDSQEFDPAHEAEVAKLAKEYEIEKKAQELLAISSSIDRSAAMRSMKDADPELFEAVKAKFEALRSQGEKTKPSAE